MIASANTMSPDLSPPALAPARASKPFQGWIVAFMLFLFLNQLALLVPALAPFRVVFRIASFGSSLALLALLRGRTGSPLHPAVVPAAWAILLVGAAVVHPTTNTLLSGLAQVGLYVAILAPLFWVPRLRVDVQMLRRLILVIWGFHTLSATVGIVQVMRPGTFQFNVSSIIASRGESYVYDLAVVTESGEIVLRPMGLTDIPGGASNSGFYAVLFGMGFLLIDRRRWFRLVCLASFGIGMACLYLAQVRSVLLIAAGCLLVFGGVLLWRKHVARSGLLALVLGVGLVGAFVWAATLSSGGVAERFLDLLKARPDQIFFENRGQFLVETIERHLPRYPLGAGVGRWGMANMYFGSNSDPARAPIWVEIQWTGWLLDGGVPLVIAYAVAVLLACWVAWKISRRSVTNHLELSLWAALILAYNAGVLVLTFSYPVFIAQWGMEFWLLNATLFAAAVGVAGGGGTRERAAQ